MAFAEVGTEGAQAARAWPTVLRRGPAADRTAAARCPLISSMRENSSSRPRVSHRCHNSFRVPCGGLDRAARPRAVNTSFPEESSARPPAWSSSGQAKAAMGSAG